MKTLSVVHFITHHIISECTPKYIIRSQIIWKPNIADKTPKSGNFLSQNKKQTMLKKNFSIESEMKNFCSFESGHELLGQSAHKYKLPFKFFSLLSSPTFSGRQQCAIGKLVHYNPIISLEECGRNWKLSSSGSVCLCNCTQKLRTSTSLVSN